ncbi:ATP-dependent DNA helicase RecG [Williamsia sp. 1135]|uniref:ATP-dependent DNA helicase RecG n=1 Tax=Williamsia sp. 1135 TaxID=1889262 RepID=UPI000A100D31|nr:ATP-dependent DNA helicase RecG [Williamsia sp. 1135]ORM29135.1 ATP-dependent DNA helicase RecG [Williamsia sp. 1135]
MGSQEGRVTAPSATLSDSLESILGPKAADMLDEQIHVQTVGELLRYVPDRYVKQGDLSGERKPEPGERLTVVARVEDNKTIPIRNSRKKMVKLVVFDGKFRIAVTFFNSPWIAAKLPKGSRVMMAGEVKYFRDELQLTHPNWLKLPEDGTSIEADDAVGSVLMQGIAKALATDAGDGDSSDGTLDFSDFLRDVIPVYRGTAKLQAWTIWQCVRAVLGELAPIEDPLPDDERTLRGLIGSDEALRKIHVPEGQHDIDQASARLRFDEALALQLALAQRRHVDRGATGPSCSHVPDGLEDKLLSRLPFTLTDGQRVVIDEITADLQPPYGGDAATVVSPMSRLLQGEVGSGKTLVALLAMLRVIDNGYQCALLAPTEVLAAQHFRTLETMLGGLAKEGELEGEEGATRVALITGSMKTAAKRTALLETVTGQVGILIGTHALLQDNVDFFNLGFVVVDEQHRFGVEQRDTLRSRGRDGVVPHLLVMTATPIPRTVAMTVFGDLETSTLRELPRGRQPITTSVVPRGNPKWVQRVWQRVGEEVEEGRQVYVVCARIGDDGTPAGQRSQQKSSEGAAEPATAAVDMFKTLSEGPLGGHRIELLHGRLSPDEKSEVMADFTAGQVDILVSTTVIEVGVDVPNATTMVIVDADRFGVSQLHQLRGRVGRGGLPGLCLLITASSEMSPSMERLQAVAASNDGFELSYVDLRQRREGDLLGSLQSGQTSSLRFLSLLTDGDLIEDTRALADEVVGGDLTLVEHKPMAALVDSILGPVRLAFLDKS